MLSSCEFVLFKVCCLVPDTSLSMNMEIWVHFLHMLIASNSFAVIFVFIIEYTLCKLDASIVIFFLWDCFPCSVFLYSYHWTVRRHGGEASCCNLSGRRLLVLFSCILIIGQLSGMEVELLVAACREKTSSFVFLYYYHWTVMRHGGWGSCCSLSGRRLLVLFSCILTIGQLSGMEVELLVAACREKTSSFVFLYYYHITVMRHGGWASCCSLSGRRLLVLFSCILIIGQLSNMEVELLVAACREKTSSFVLLYSYHWTVMRHGGEASCCSLSGRRLLVLFSCILIIRQLLGMEVKLLFAACREKTSSFVFFYSYH